MLFVPPSIPFMVPEAEAATYTISVDPSVGIGFSQSALTIAQGDSVTFTTTVPPPQWVSITDPAGGFHQFDTNNPVTWTFNQCGIIVFWDESSPAQFAPMTLTVGDCPPDTTPPVISIPEPLASGITHTTADPEGAFLDLIWTGPYSWAWNVLDLDIATDNVGIDTSYDNIPQSTNGVWCNNEDRWNGNFQPQQLKFTIGTTTITCETKDTSGNVGSASFTVTVVLEEAADTTPPVVTLNSILSYDGSSGTTIESGNISATASSGSSEHFVAFNVTASGAATTVVNGFSITVSCEPVFSTLGMQENGDFNYNIPIGTTTVTCTASDVVGNVGTTSFTVTVNYTAPADTTPPTITFPSAIANGVVLPYPAPNFVDGHIFTWLVVATIVSDNVAIDTSLGLPITQYASAAGLNCDKEHLWNINHSSWQEFPSGDTTITCTATDTSGNIGTASFTVTAVYEASADTTLADTTPAAAIVIPDWIKNNAEWWADGLIDNFAFVTGLQWLITNGIMVIG